MTNLTGNISDIGVLWNEIRRLRAVAKGVDISKIDEAMPMTGREQEEFKQWAYEYRWRYLHLFNGTPVDRLAPAGNGNAGMHRRRMARTRGAVEMERRERMKYTGDVVARIEQVLLEKAIVVAKDIHLDTMAPMMAGNMELIRYMAADIRTAVYRLQASVIKGDTEQSHKWVKHTYDFQVFESWTDHLKYQLREGRMRGLAWARGFWPIRGLKVRYITVSKTRDDQVPVSILRVCPHADFKWEGRQHVHIAFLHPEKYGPMAAEIEEYLDGQGT